MELSSCAGSREGDPVSQWEAGPVQEAGGAVGTRTGQGKLAAAGKNCFWFAKLKSFNNNKAFLSRQSLPGKIISVCSRK